MVVTFCCIAFLSAIVVCISVLLVWVWAIRKQKDEGRGEREGEEGEEGEEEEEGERTWLKEFERVFNEFL
jgi:flagellar biosynthesis/type III secretory pathway M-ring protein FliF/YscJ